MQIARRATRALALVALSLFASVTHPAERRVPDTIAQRVQACVTCHGKEGRATNAGWFPRIAGKPAGYLYNQLVNFRDGRRQNAAMAYLLDNLSDAYLREIAEYFASLDLPYPPPQTTGASASVLQRGEALVKRGDASRDLPACSACHGEALTGAAPTIPGLLGLPRDYITGQFAYWASGQRKAAAPDCMGHVVSRLSADDIRALATWLSSQPVPVPSHPAAAIPAPLPIDCGSAR